MTDQMEYLAEVFKSPGQLVSAELSLCLATSMGPSERSTDEEPPGWADRYERWTIDELLGLYEPHKREITLFTKGIEHVAEQLRVKFQIVEYLVRIHEYAHAVFHIGVDLEKSYTLAKAFNDDDPSLERATVSELTAIFDSVDPHVHEQIAQVITRLVLEELRTPEQ